jgi:hypothetical protein
MAKRLIEKKIMYYETLLTERHGFFRRLMIKYWIYCEKCKLKKYETNHKNTI